MLRLFSLSVVLTAILASGLSRIQAAPSAAPAAVNRVAAWTGVITYTRTQSQSETKTVERVSNRGKDTREWQMKLDYQATVGVAADPHRKGSSVGKASITHRFTSKETTVAVERNSCDRGKTWRDMTGTFISETIVSGEGKDDANVHVGINTDGTYTVSVGLPQFQGTVTGAQSSTFSGQCTPKPGKNLTLPPTPTTIEGQSLTSDGSHRLDPKDPSRLSGSYSRPFPGGVESITWSLQKNAAPLRLIALKFEDMKFPTWDAWQEISEQTGTVDGNWVKIRATVLNGASETKTAEVFIKETYKGDKWDGARPDLPLKDQTFTVTLEPGEQREVEMLWDTRGYAWFDDGRPRLVQRLKAEVWENQRQVDELTKNLKVRPRPLVLVPGLWSDPHAFEIFQNLLTTAHSYDWKAATARDLSAHGRIQGEGTTPLSNTSRSVYDHADNLATYVDATRTALNAWHVDVLAHSTGGLVARLYVHKHMAVLPDHYPVVRHLLLAGTPNHGVPCGDAPEGGDANGTAARTLAELHPDEMAVFNRFVMERKGTVFSALVGNGFPLLCGRPQWSDGHVSAESARHGVEDVTFTRAKHRELISTETFSGYVRAHLVVGPRGTYPFAAIGGN
jgi:pimeloyl-ACP methyl ester carboxylesterase